MHRMISGRGFLPDPQTDHLRRLMLHALGRGWTVSIVSCDDPYARLPHWEPWPPAVSTLHELDTVITALEACRTTHADRFIQVVVSSSDRGYSVVRASFIAHRPRNARRRMACYGHAVRRALEHHLALLRAFGDSATD